MGNACGLIKLLSGHVVPYSSRCNGASSTIRHPGASLPSAPTREQARMLQHMAVGSDATATFKREDWHLGHVELVCVWHQHALPDPEGAPVPRHGNCLTTPLSAEALRLRHVQGHYRRVPKVQRGSPISASLLLGAVQEDGLRFYGGRWTTD